MRHCHSNSSFRFSIAALPQDEGYVEALLGLARVRGVSGRVISLDKPTRSGVADGAKFDNRRLH
jgi:hypothetical protein